MIIDARPTRCGPLLRKLRKSPDQPPKEGPKEEGDGFAGSRWSEETECGPVWTAGYQAKAVTSPRRGGRSRLLRSNRLDRVGTPRVKSSPTTVVRPAPASRRCGAGCASPNRRR